MSEPDGRKIVIVEESQFSLDLGKDLDEDVRELLQLEVSTILYVRSAILKFEGGSFVIVVTPVQPELIETVRGSTIDHLRSLSPELGLKVVRREKLSPS